MKLKYEAQKGSRFKSSKFFGICCKESDWWYVEKTRTWKFSVTESDCPYGSHDHTCNSVKGFRRRLKKLPKGLKFTLVHRYNGFNVHGKGSGK